MIQGGCPANFLGVRCPFAALARRQWFRSGRLQAGAFFFLLSAVESYEREVFRATNPALHHLMLFSWPESLELPPV
jgi:hypothetical protein